MAQVACGWFAIGQKSGGWCSKVLDYADEAEISDKGLWQWYLLSFYWSTTTLTTVRV
jgi:hypothetical protein